ASASARDVRPVGTVPGAALHRRRRRWSRSPHDRTSEATASSARVRSPQDRNRNPVALSCLSLLSFGRPTTEPAMVRSARTRRLGLRAEPKWRNGRRGGLKHRWGPPRVGSNPTFGTIARAWAKADDPYGS